MAVNRRRGEIEATLDGRAYRLCLTLGALAELETAFEAEDLSALAARFATGKLSATDLVRIVGAGLRGGGAAIGDDEVAAMRHEDGLTGIAAVAVELLRVTFGDPEAANP